MLSNLIANNAIGRMTLPWCYPARWIGAAAERIRLDELSLSAAGIARFNISR
jgi:hypothetical protein